MTSGPSTFEPIVPTALALRRSPPFSLITRMTQASSSNPVVRILSLTSNPLLFLLLLRLDLSSFLYLVSSYSLRERIPPCPSYSTLFFSEQEAKKIRETSLAYQPIIWSHEVQHRYLRAQFLGEKIIIIQNLLPLVVARRSQMRW